MSIPTRPLKNLSRGGFSLIEVVLALGVISFALVAILGVFPAGSDANRLSISDTRAAQLASAVTATIDAQSAIFSSVDCFGAPLDLAVLTTTDDPVILHASYSSPTRPEITSTVEANSIYQIELRFDNDPELAQTTPPVRLGPGKLNQIQIRIMGKSAASGFVEFFHLVRKQP